MDSRESHNYFKLVYIVLDIVSGAMRNVFKTEWNALYPPWQDDQQSLQDFCNKERPFYALSPTNRTNMTNLRKTTGDSSTWDVTLLCYTLIYSLPLDLKHKPNKHTEAGAIDNLRKLRNEVIHRQTAKITDADFKRIYSDIKTEIRKFRLPNQTHIAMMKDAKNNSLAQSELDRLEQEVAEEKLKLNRQKRRNVIEYSLFSGFIVLILFMLYFLFINFVPQSVPSYFPAYQIPEHFIGRENEISESVKIIRGDTRVVILHGLSAFGKKSTSLIIGQKLQSYWWPYPWLSVCFVSLRGVKDVHSLQKKIMESFYIFSNDNVAQIFTDFITFTIKRRTLIILDECQDLLETKATTDPLRVLTDVLDWNKNIALVINYHSPIYMIKHAFKNVLIKEFSIKESQQLLQNIAPVVGNEMGLELAEYSRGIPLFVSLFGYLVKEGLNADSLAAQVKDTLSDKDEIQNISEYQNILQVLMHILDGDQLIFLAYGTLFPVQIPLSAMKRVGLNTESVLSSLHSVGIIWNITEDNAMQIYDFHSVYRTFVKRALLTKFPYLILKYYIAVAYSDIEGFLEKKCMSFRNPTILTNDKGSITLIFEQNVGLEIIGDPRIEFEYFDMIIASTHLFLFEMHDKVFTKYVYYHTTVLLSAASNHSDVYKTRFLQLLFSQSDRGDVFAFNNRRDKYEKLVESIEENVDTLANEATCTTYSDMIESATCLLVIGRTLALYSQLDDASKKLKAAGDIEKGLALINQAIGIFSENGLQREMAEGLSSKGLIYVQVGKYIDAKEAYEQSLNIYLRMYRQHPLVAAGYFNIGFVFYKHGGFNAIAAVELYRKSYEIYNNTLGIHRRTFTALLYTGQTLQYLGEFRHSMTPLANAYETQENLMRIETDTVKTLRDKLDLDCTKRLHDNAMATAEQHIRNSQIPENTDLTSSFQVFSHGNCFNSLGDHDKAKRYYDATIAKLQQMCQTDVNLCYTYQLVLNHILANEVEEDTVPDDNEDTEDFEIKYSYISLTLDVIYSLVLGSWTLTLLTCSMLYFYINRFMYFGDIRLDNVL